MTLAVNNQRRCHKGNPAKEDSAKQVPPPCQKKKKKKLSLCAVPPNAERHS